MSGSPAFKCLPVTTRVGAVVEGVDITRPLSPDAQGFVQDAIVNHGVIFFRDQELSPEQMKAFARYFAEPIPEPFSPEIKKDREPVTEGDMQVAKSGTAVWHHDTTFVEKPPYYTVLRAVRVPPYGGDTCWASMYAAYDALAAPLRAALDGLTAVHSVAPVVRRMGGRGNKHMEASFGAHGYDCVHPVVIAHPITGRKALFVNEGWVTEIVGLSPIESRHLLAMLFEHIKLPDFNMRWHWTANDVAMWDNRSVQHFAVPDYSSERVMQRVVTSGPQPVAAR